MYRIGDCGKGTHGAPLRKAYVVISTTCGDICGDSHHRLRSPQVLVVVYTTSSYHHKYFVVILYKVGSTLREHNESITVGANVFKRQCLKRKNIQSNYLNQQKPCALLLLLIVIAIVAVNCCVLLYSCTLVVLAVLDRSLVVAHSLVLSC